jgi:hypothetical protein
MNVLCLFVLLLLASCSTSKKLAQQLASQGLHEAAVPKWIEALNESPNDAEVQVGLKISQEKVLNDRLVEIRDLRNSKKYEEAILSLKKLIDTQNEWKTTLDFNSSTFQGKELQALWSYESDKLKRLANSGKVLAASQRDKEVSYIFNSLEDYKKTKDFVSAKGASKCVELKTHADSISKPFYSNFVNRFCGYYENKREVAASKEGISGVLFSSVASKVVIQGVNENMISELSKKVQEHFQETPWYDQVSKKSIRVELNGKYTWIPTNQDIHQVHNYKVSIPYTAYVPVMKTRQVPYQATEYRCVWNQYAGNTCGNVSVTHYRSEFYFVNEAVTRYREEARAYEYVATKHSQDLVLQFKGKIYIGSDTIPIAFSKHTTESKILHELNMPDIGLFPSREDVSSPISAFTEFADESSARISNEIDQFWVRKFCSFSKSRGIASEAESILRCRKSSSHPKANVDSWFSNSFGVTSDEAEGLIGSY